MPWRRLLSFDNSLAVKPWSAEEFEKGDDKVVDFIIRENHTAILQVIEETNNRLENMSIFKILHYCITNENIPMFDKAIECQNLSAERMTSALRCAVENGRLPFVEKLLCAGADFIEHSNTGLYAGQELTIFQSAASQGLDTAVMKMLELGASPNEKLRPGGKTPLQAASAGGHTRIIEILVNAGADVNAEPAECWGRTALQSAAENGCLEVVERLLVRGANANAKPADRDGLGALQAAVDRGYHGIARKLVWAGARVNPLAGERTARTPLLSAAERGDTSLVDRLIAYGADVDAQLHGPSGRTALIAAAEAGQSGAVRKLLK